MRKKLAGSHIMPPTAMAAKHLRDLRQRLRWTQQDLAFRMGKSMRSISRWESEGVIGRQGLRELQQLAKETGHDDLANAFFQDAVTTVVPDPASGVCTDEGFWQSALRTLLIFRDRPEV